MSKQMDGTSPEESTYFSLQSSWGITNHIGGIRATKNLIQQCHIKPNDNVLIVGCGSGKTVAYIVQKHGCRVTSIDISEDMVKLAERRAAREEFAEQVDSIVADAQNLPFYGDEFDAVICESVNSFVSDKLGAMREYHRVVKPGKNVGINEVTWLQKPKQKITDYFVRTMNSRPLEANVWRDIMETAGLKNITCQLFHPNMLTMWYDEMRQMGFPEAFHAWGKFFKMMIKGSPEIKKYIRATWPPPWNILSYMGYGIYTGTG